MKAGVPRSHLHLQACSGACVDNQVLQADLLLPPQHSNPLVFMPGIHITDIEAAINYWREKKPSPDGLTLAPELRALAEVYALLVFYHEEEADERSFPPEALAAWLAWYDTTADTPCIAICSTSQGDAVCKGCGRQFEEVQHWPAMSPAVKRAIWRRITLDATSWRFGRYHDRALEKS